MGNSNSTACCITSCAKKGTDDGEWMEPIRRRRSSSKRRVRALPQIDDRKYHGKDDDVVVPDSALLGRSSDEDLYRRRSLASEHFIRSFYRGKCLDDYCNAHQAHFPTGVPTGDPTGDPTGGTTSILKIPSTKVLTTTATATAKEPTPKDKKVKFKTAAKMITSVQRLQLQQHKFVEDEIVKQIERDILQEIVLAGHNNSRNPLSNIKSDKSGNNSNNSKNSKNGKNGKEGREKLKSAAKLVTSIQRLKLLTSKFTTEEDNQTMNAKEAILCEGENSTAPITSIVALGHGYFLTASKSCRSIKLWRARMTLWKKTVSFASDVANVNNSTHGGISSADSGAISDAISGVGVISSADSAAGVARPAAGGTRSASDSAGSVTDVNGVTSSGNLRLRSKLLFVRDFEGHSSGVTSLAKLDDKGRFLSSSLDRTVKLWDSRYNIADSDPSDSSSPVLLATFSALDTRWIKSLTVIDSGSYVRPTDDIDSDMLVAMAKKVVMEGTHAMHHAATDRQIIECSGTFASVRKNGSCVKIWGMTVLAQPGRKHDQQHNQQHDQQQPINPSDENTNIAQVNLLQELKHDAAIEVIKASPQKELILTGDSAGDVFLWKRQRPSLLLPKVWIRLQKFTWKRKSKVRTVTETYGHAISSLTFLHDASKVISGTRNGTLHVWDISHATPHKATNVVTTKEAVKIVATRSMLSCIQELPLMTDPKTKQSCPAFSTTTLQGQILSIALCPNPNPRSESEPNYRPFCFKVTDCATDGFHTRQGRMRRRRRRTSRGSSLMGLNDLGRVGRGFLLTGLTISGPMSYRPTRLPPSNDSEGDDDCSPCIPDQFLISGDEFGRIHISWPYWNKTTD